MLICGVDEAGRGPIAGPVTSAAVILPDHFQCDGLNDSKKLSVQMRQQLAQQIKKHAVGWSIGWSWNEEIERINIHRATLLSMTRAIRALPIQPDLVLVDGLFTPPIHTTSYPVVKGDTYIPQIQAASILAKVSRDKWMERYSRIEPDYLFDKHKGYPTREHKDRVKNFGLSPIHRKNFNIVFP